MGLDPDQPLAPSAHFVYQRPRRDAVWGWIFGAAWIASAVLGVLSFVHRRGEERDTRGGGGGALRRGYRESGGR